MASSVDLGRQLRLLEEREKRIVALDAAIARGKADVAAGRVKPADDVLKRLDAKYRKMARSRVKVVFCRPEGAVGPLHA